MLIAMMGLTFDVTIDNTHEGLKEQINIIADWGYIMHWFGAKGGQQFLFYVIVLDDDFNRDDEDEDAQFESRIVQMRRELLQLKHQMKKIITKQNKRMAIDNARN